MVVARSKDERVLNRRSVSMTTVHIAILSLSNSYPRKRPTAGMIHPFMDLNNILYFIKMGNIVTSHYKYLLKSGRTTLLPTSRVSIKKEKEKEIPIVPH